MNDKPKEKSKTKNYIPRITQLDAIEFDKEIHNVLSSELQKVAQYLKPGALHNVKSEINLLLNLLMFRYSVMNKNASFGQQLLSLQYSTSLSKNKLYLYALLNYVLPYIKNKYEENSSRVQNEWIRKVLQNIEIFIKSCQFLNLLIFVRQGTYPSIVHRLLKLTFAPVGKLNRNVGYNYMTRELLWHGFMELIMYILPLINYKAIKRKLKNAISIKSNKLKSEKSIIYNVDTKCIICDDFPNLPCQISSFCSHLACYYCLKSNVLADEKFACPACGETNMAHDGVIFLQG